MSMQMIGGLMVQLAADVANLKKDMAEAEKVVDKGALAMSKGLDIAKSAFIGLAGALSMAAIYNWVKAAADAGDEMKQFSQKTGVAVEDVAGLQLAFKQGGVESGALQGAIAKMSKQMAEGSDTFKKMGVETRNADGTLRSAKDVLYDVADATKDMGSSLNTTALLTGVFGKGAAQMIPTLLEGSEGMRDMDEMARKLGLTMSSDTAEAADKFNDTVELLGLGLTGVGRQVAAQLLPTLSNLAASFLENMTEGNRLQKVADGLSTVLKGVYTVVMVVAEAFNTFGTIIGGTVASVMARVTGLGEAIVKVFQGDFKGAAKAAEDGWKRSAQISDDMSKDIAAGWTSTGKAISTAWADSSNKSVTALTDLERKGKQVTIMTKEQEEAAKAAAAAAKKNADEVEKLTQGLDKQIATMALEDETQQKLTASQKTALDIMLKIQDGSIKLTDAQKREITSKLEQIAASEEHQKQLANEKKWMDETAKSNDAYAASIEKSTQSIRDEVEKLRESNQMLGLSKEATAALEIAKLEEQATAKDRLATWAEENMLGDDLVEQFKAQAEGLRELAKLKGEKVHLEAAVEARDAWQKTSEEIGKSFTDSLFRAFESGKSFGEAMMDGLKNLFKTTVLKLLIQPVQLGMSNAIGSLFGQSGSSAGGGSNLFGMLGNGLSAFGDWMGANSTIGGWASTAGNFLKGNGTGSLTGSVLGMMGNFGGGLSAGYGSMLAGNAAGGWSAGTTAIGAGNISGGIGTFGGMAAGAIGGFMAGRGVGQAISGGYSAIGGQSGNSAVNTGTAVGAAIGSIIPGIGTMIGGLIGGALGGLVNRTFGHGAKEYNGDKGIEGTLGGTAGLSGGQSWADWTKKGGWFRSDKHGTDKFGLDADTSKALSEGALAVRKQTEDWAKALGLPAERLASITTSFNVKLTDKEEENQKILAKVFSDYATVLTNSFDDVIAPFQKAGESIADTMQRLTAIQAFSEAVNEFGGVFSKIAQLSISAKEELVAFAGGIEAFSAKASQFVTDYYTDSEKYGLQAKQLRDAFASIGLTDAGALSSKAEFRKLVESQDLNTQEGRLVFNQLLELAPMFASVGQYLEQNQQTLGQLAEAAPVTAMLEGVLADKEVQAKHQAAVEAAAQAQLDAINSGNQMITDAIDRLWDKLGGLEGAFNNFGRILERGQAENIYTNRAQP